MPGPVIADPTPDWLKRENASVTDSALTKALRMIGSLIGADNPTAQVFGLMMTDVPGGPPTGGLAKAVGQLKERAIKAYHGSPHDFERFSLEKIGTGEGAQAYGHGLYFAEKEGTAQSYKNVLGGREFDVKGRKLYSSSGGATNVIDKQSRAETMAADALDDAFNAQSTSPAQFAANRLRKAQQLYPEEASHIHDALSVIADWQGSGQAQKLKGSMYEVAIHADPDDFLDWDKPLSQQSEKVQNAVKALGPKNEQARQFWEKVYWKQNPSGEAIYRDVTPDAGGIPAERNATAATALRQTGIPGIKYLDQGSRRNVQLLSPQETTHGQWLVKELPNGQVLYRGVDESAARTAYTQHQSEQTRNYVVFDDKLIDILKKYGLLLPATGAAGQTTISQRQQP